MRKPESTIVVIGGSLGGLTALQTLLTGLPNDFKAPMAVVLHCQPDFNGEMCALLQERTPLLVVEAEDKEAIVPGRIYLAPADYHLLVEKGNFALSIDPRVWYSRPSIDVLFESAAIAYGKGVIGVILTGANQDGAAGLAAIKKRGGITVVQDPKTAESSVMPQAAIDAAKIDEILPLEQIAPYLARVCTFAGRNGVKTKKERTV